MFFKEDTAKYHTARKSSGKHADNRLSGSLTVESLKERPKIKWH